MIHYKSTAGQKKDQAINLPQILTTRKFTTWCCFHQQKFARRGIRTQSFRKRNTSNQKPLRKCRCQTFRGCDLKHRWSLDLESLLNFHFSSPTDYCIYCFSFICTSTPCIQPSRSDLRWQNLLWSMNCMICLEWSCVGWLRCVDWLFRPLFKSPSHDFTSRSFGKAQE